MPLVTSNNLSLVQLVTGQTNPEQTANDKGSELDSFLTAVKTYDFTSAGATTTTTDFMRYRKFKITNNTAGRTLTLQAIPRQVVIDNSASSNSAALSITLGSTTLSLATGMKGLFETDGTANGLELILSNDDASKRVQSVTASGATTIDRSKGEAVILTLNANSTIAVTNWPSGLLGSVVIEVRNSGAFNITGWPSGTKWPSGTVPTITSGASKVDQIILSSLDGGTTIRGAIIGQNFS